MSARPIARSATPLSLAIVAGLSACGGGEAIRVRADRRPVPGEVGWLSGAWRWTVTTAR